MAESPGKIGVLHADVETAWSDIKLEDGAFLPGKKTPIVEGGADAAALSGGKRTPLVGQTEAELENFAKELGEPTFRGRQLYEWIYHQAAASFDEMTNISKKFRARLTETHQIHPLKLAARRPSTDGSAKLLFELADGKFVEGVLMPQGGRLTLCISSQVGCAVDCQFCLTGRMGFSRNLAAGEIVSQALIAARDPLVTGIDSPHLTDGSDQSLPPGIEPAQLTNIVFMGMGEPLLNPRGVIDAIQLLTDTSGRGMNIAGRRITVSTAGVVPGIRKLSDADVGIKLAVSLNGTTDEQRAATMPINNVYPIAELIDAVTQFKRRRRQDRVTFEYVMMAGFNDTLEDARRLVSLVGRLKSKVNLIPFNPDPALPYKRPDRATVQAFLDVLHRAEVSSSVRWSKALDVDAACGQLAGRWRPDNTSGGC